MRIKIGTRINEAISSLIATSDTGPTAGAAILINKKDAPHAAPIPKINSQSNKEDLLFIYFYSELLRPYRIYEFFHSGSLFSKKASIPSFASSAFKFFIILSEAYSYA